MNLFDHKGLPDYTFKWADLLDLPFMRVRDCITVYKDCFCYLISH